MNDGEYKIKFGTKKEQIRIRDNIKKMIKFGKKKIIIISEVAKWELFKQRREKCPEKLWLKWKKVNVKKNLWGGINE